MTLVTTHRGLDPDRGSNYFKESSREAFIDQLVRGYGLEFDVRFLENNKAVVSHDGTFNPALHFTLYDFFEYLKKYDDGRVSALHLKAVSQKREHLDILLPLLATINPKSIIIFDVTLETAKYLKSKNKELVLAPSVAHPYDIERFGNVVGDTLISLQEALAHRDLFDWVWLDEWDRATKPGSREGSDKTFYNPEVFAKLREHGFKIGLVTPELHGTSPGLLGGEAHPDATPDDRLHSRINEILALKPDLVCTDHPDRVQTMIQEISS